MQLKLLNMRWEEIQVETMSHTRLAQLFAHTKKTNTMGVTTRSTSLASFRPHSLKVIDGRGAHTWSLQAYGLTPTQGLTFELLDVSKRLRRCTQPGEDAHHVVIESGNNTSIPDLIFDVKLLPLLHSARVQTCYFIQLPEVILASKFWRY